MKKKIENRIEDVDIAERCSICNAPLSHPFNNHNADPIPGRCCSICNDRFVIPLRLARLTRTAMGDVKAMGG